MDRRSDTDTVSARSSQGSCVIDAVASVITEKLYLRRNRRADDETNVRLKAALVALVGEAQSRRGVRLSSLSRAIGLPCNR